jgi:hypothetical protein
MDTKEVEFAVKEKIASILKLPDTNGWNVTDFIEDKHLYCVHYDRYANMLEYGQVRGVIVDTENSIVVCKSYGYTPNIETDDVTFEDGKIKLVDVSDYEYLLDVSKTRFRIGFESTVMRVWKHDGDVYTSTHRRINPDRSRWGNSTPFKKMYQDLGGPTEELFGDEPYSPWCHIFLMVHPDILLASKIPAGKGFLVYLGALKTWDLGDTGFESLKGFDPKKLEKPLEPKKYVKKMPVHPQKPVVYWPDDVSLVDANRQLKWGFYEEFKMADRRLETGEFIILTEVDDQERVIRTFRVSSVPYMWRVEMRDNNPNLYHRWFQLADGQFIDTSGTFGLEQFRAKYPILTPYKNKDIEKFVKRDLITWPQLDKTTTASPEEVNEMLDKRPKRLHNIWQCYLAAAPLGRQEGIVTMYDQYFEDRYRVINWLQDIENTTVQLDNVGSEYSDRVKNIIEETRKYAVILSERGNTRFKNMKQLVHKNIYDLIMKEGGFSLYRLRKLMLSKLEPAETSTE